ncbi:31704_t:CDS:2 [Gigaspora margarita]|uniref:31704_t:CDS:1 n=1 Tax=Gigaspora margarita TaxID=4874 RepID=A0ABN7VCI6_GIGMA|nr:31704_t:CDS:2 [Gigaspora margarita]
MLSIWSVELNKIDFLSSKLGFYDIGTPSPASEEYFVTAKALADKIALKKSTIVSHPSFTEVPHFHLYCANEALAIPYVSPMLAESLGNLPPILCNFIKCVTCIENNNISMIDLVKEDLVPLSISVYLSLIAMRINTNGEIKELNETDRDCLKWDKIGIVPKET